MVGWWPRLVAVLVVVLVAVPVAPVAAVAEPSAPVLTWAVQPADARGPDGRRWIERTVEAGQVVTEYVAVRNFSGRAVVFGLAAADGYLTDKGRFNMLPADRVSVGAGTWIRVREQVRVGAGAMVVVPFTVTVPRDARPGDHPAGIAATVSSGAGGAVAVHSRVGFRVMLRVSGTVTGSLGIEGLTASFRRSWNPLAAGTVRVRYTTRNDGAVAVTGAGQVSTAELFGAVRHGAGSGVPRLLPGGSRQVRARVGGVWGLGRLKTTVELTPAVVDGQATGVDIKRTSATVTVWTLPWPQLLLAALLTALALSTRAAIRHRRQRLADLLTRARDEGRAEGQRSAPGD